MERAEKEIKELEAEISHLRAVSASLTERVSTLEKHKQNQQVQLLKVANSLSPDNLQASTF